MKKPLIIIKIGGSIITEKSGNTPKFRKSVFKRIVKEILYAKKQKDFDLILIHGAGSFGHPYALRYKLNLGFSVPESTTGISVTKSFVLKLNHLVINELISNGLNACLVETSSVLKTSKGKIAKFNLEPINDFLSAGIVPVLSGDVVFDAKNVISIVSGDKILASLAQSFSASKIIFASDVDGIFDKNPKTNKNAKLIKEVNEKNYKDVLEKIEQHNLQDVTGEMKGKILAIRNSLANHEVLMISGLKTSMVKNCLLHGMYGTRVSF